MIKGIATKQSLRIQGAQNSVTNENVREVNLIPALKTSSSNLELIYSAATATNRVPNERVSILFFPLDN